MSECTYRIVPDNGRKKIIVHHNRLKTCASLKLVVTRTEDPILPREHSSAEIGGSREVLQSTDTPLEEEIQMVEIPIPSATDKATTSHGSVTDPVSSEETIARDFQPPRIRTPSYLRDLYSLIVKNFARKVI